MRSNALYIIFFLKRQAFFKIDFSFKRGSDHTHTRINLHYSYLCPPKPSLLTPPNPTLLPPQLLQKKNFFLKWRGKCPRGPVRASRLIV